MADDMIEYRQGLERLARENGRVSVPAYMHEFFRSNKDLSFEEMYSKILEVIPLDKQVPTYNEALLYYNLDKLQTTADRLYTAITMLLKEIDEGNVKQYDGEKKLRSLQSQYNEISSMIMRYSDSGINRETPKQMNINVNHLDLNSIHQQIRDIRNITPDNDETPRD
jgi:hypothetical protein